MVEGPAAIEALEFALGTSSRVDRPDGTALVIDRDRDGTVTASQLSADGSVVEKRVAELSGTGVVVAVTDDQGRTTVVEPESVESQTNLYGATVERLDFGKGLEAEHSFNDDGDLRVVVMSGDWGEQTLELRPDGARNLQWKTTFHEGAESRGADGRMTRFEVTLIDGTSHRWDQIEDGWRQTVVGIDGRPSVLEVQEEPSTTGSSS